VLAGVALLIIEIFVTPGFGVAGIAGIGALLSGLSLSLIGGGATWDFILRALSRVVVSLLLAIAASLILLRFLPRLPLGKRLILSTDLGAEEGYASTPETDRQWLGKTGTAISPLRPSGIGDFDGERVDVVSDGDFIERGAQVVVTRVDGNRIVVRRARGATEEEEK
jgi:membrane-bound serine protease (ClpP class)